MTSISSLTSTALSPLDLLQNELSSEVSAGTISSSDQDALSAALKDIDSTLKSQGSSGRASGSAPPSPSEMKSKIDSLIENEVSSGKLTSSQASELKNVFANAFANGGPGGAGGPGGPGGPPPGGGGQSDSSTDSSTTSSSTSSSSSGSDIEQVLKNFLALLQQSNSTSSGYDATGQTTSSVTASLLINYRADVAGRAARVRPATPQGYGFNTLVRHSAAGDGPREAPDRCRNPESMNT